MSVEQALADGMRAARRLPDRERGGTYPAPAATAVVLDPDDGALLALASLPQYDPRRFVGGISRRDFARYSSNPGKPLLHRAVQSAYPPGSTWKPFTALAGLRPASSRAPAPTAAPARSPSAATPSATGHPGATARST